jgi:hypothetical protein
MEDRNGFDGEQRDEDDECRQQRGPTTYSAAAGTTPRILSFSRWNSSPVSTP